jgi:hypothetical protein
MDYQTALNYALGQLGIANGDEIDVLRSIPGINTGTETLTGFANQINGNPSLVSSLPSYYAPILQYLNMGQQSDVQATSPVPASSRPDRLSQTRPAVTRTEGTTFPNLNTRSGVPSLAVDPPVTSSSAINPYNYNQVGQSVQSGSNPATNARIMTQQYAGSGTSGNTSNMTLPTTNNFRQTSNITPVNSTNTTVPTLGMGTQNTYNPTPYSNASDSNGFLNSSGGFAYDMLPGMFNYMMQYLGSGMNQSSGNSNAMNQFVNNSVTSGYPSGMSQYLQDMTGYLGSGQTQYGTNMQNAAGNTANYLANGQTYQTDLQRQVGNTLSQLIAGSGLSPAYVSALTQDILQPGLQNLEGELNRMGGGVVAPTSGLQMELKNDMMSDFNNQLVRTGFENLSNFLNQATQSEGQNFNQTLNTANLQGNLGNQAISNALNATAQGGNLLSNYMSAANQAQANQNQYTLGLANQYGNLTSDYLRAYLADQAIKNQNKQSSNASLGSGLASILGALLSGGNSSGTGTGTGSSTSSGGGGNIVQLIKDIFGAITGNKTGNTSTGTGTTNPTGGLPTGVVGTNVIDDPAIWNTLPAYYDLLDVMGIIDPSLGITSPGVFDNSWENLLNQSGIYGENVPVDWGSLFSEQPSTYQYYDTYYDTSGVDDWMNYMLSMYTLGEG